MLSDIILLLMIVTTLIACLYAAYVAQAFGLFFGHSTIISKNNGSWPSSEPQIATSGNNVYVVWRDETTGNGDIYFRRSVDNGNDFQGRVLSKNNGSSSEPQIATSGNNVYVVWRDETTGNGDIYFRRSLNSGSTTFESTKELSRNTGSSSEPQIATSGNNVYVVWRDETTGNGDIYFKRSVDNGNDFQGTKRLTRDSGISSEPQIATSGNNVYVVWKEERKEGDGDIYFRRSVDNGVTFEGTKRLFREEGSSSSKPLISVHKNNVYLAWNERTSDNAEILFQSSADYGFRFDNTTNLSKNPSLSHSPQIDASGKNICVVWLDGVNFKSNEVFFKRVSEDYFKRNGALY